MNAINLIGAINDIDNLFLENNTQLFIQYLKMTQFKTPLQGVTANDIPALIGKEGSSIKEAKRNAWRIYTALQKTERKVNEDKPKLRIELQTSENVQESGASQHSQDGCMAVIDSQSETMIKIAKQCLEDYVKSFISKNTLLPISFVLEFPSDLIGFLVSNLRGSRRQEGLIQRVISRTDAVSEADQESDVDSEDIATVRRARFWVNQMNVSSAEQLQQVLSRGSHFIGWTPGPNHEVKEMISIRITFPIVSEPLKHRDLLIERLEDIIKRISDDIKTQKARDTATMDAALDDDLVMDY